jgi:hypothetical protein
VKARLSKFAAIAEERGVAVGVNEPDPCPLPGPGGEGAGRGRDPAVDQVVREAQPASPPSSRLRPVGRSRPQPSDILPFAPDLISISILLVYSRHAGQRARFGQSCGP